MTEARLPFFVYGTLRRGQRNHALLAGRTLSWTPARLPGALLYPGPGYPFAVADPLGAAVVHGDLVRVAADVYPRVLADLDRLETYTPGDPGNLYERERRTVTTERGPAEAWVYLANGPLADELRAEGRPIAGGDWLTAARHGL
ncbi:gamma-glutamylcyclotransferase family protein [Actinacidiphila sp. DG2A-62]|uniref:gamma-glutamylcyclotransferase family protein n=1 Tax=Actinacidiphila sp. DG2A-62 TaxID=3108821 RepID=UPI002DBE9138|nr:gamma-glutamylcyclotransferase family protein [Actinacidiphila sp. DG2A-62]MEC3994129.1 gamma-glutamylcyclotransferase family protein [Actinacidiphila sp. DG2A-62]